MSQKPSEPSACVLEARGPPASAYCQPSPRSPKSSPRSNSLSSASHWDRPSLSSSPERVFTPPEGPGHLEALYLWHSQPLNARLQQRYGLSCAQQKLILYPDRDRSSEREPRWVTCCLIPTGPGPGALSKVPKGSQEAAGDRRGHQGRTPEPGCPRALGRCPRCRVKIKVSRPGSAAARSLLESPGDPPPRSPRAHPGGTHGRGVG